MMKLLKDLGYIFPKETSKHKKHYGIFECPICNEKVRTAFYHVKSGNSTKCKSCAIKQMKTKHGGKGTRLYSIWKDMKKRCNTKNKNSIDYKNYVLRNITVCDEWKNNFTSFKKWSLENGYKENLSIDRKDNNKGYTPNNCRWANKNIQSQNTRKLMSTNSSGYRGVHFSERRRKYIAQITVNKNVIYLGAFETAKEAGKAYDTYVLNNKLEHTTNKDKK